MSDDDEVRRAIVDIERGLRTDDPGFLKRVHALRRRETIATAAIFLLLAAGAMLLATGLATASPETWGTGLVALFASVLVDWHHSRGLSRTRSQRPARRHR